MTTGLPTLQDLANAFGYVESTNNYGELGPVVPSGDRAYGYYQVMGENIPSWTERWVGRRMTPEEFLADPAAQDAVFYGQMGQYYNELPDAGFEDRIRNASSRWFSGRPYDPQTDRLSDGYITNREYADRVLSRLGRPSGGDHMTMDPNAPQPTFMGGVRNTMQTIGQGLGNLFSGYQEAPQVGGATDPFAGLSRNQRMLLGFSALRDAAASLEGRDSNYFTEALGGFEQARERERLQQQGLLQNLAALQQARAFAQFSGDDRALAAFDQALNQVYAQLGGAGGVPAGVPTGTPSAAPSEVAPTEDGAQPPLTTQQRIDEINEDLQRLATGPMMGVDTTAQMQLLMDERDRLAALQEEQIVEAEETGREAARAQEILLPRIDAAMEYLVVDGEINPALTAPGGMALFRTFNPAAYRDLENVLTTIRSGQLLETLQEVTTGALSNNEMEVFGGTEGTYDINDPIGTVRSLINLQQTLREFLASEAAAQSTAPQDNPFTDID